MGRITQADSERFAFDPAHNILSDGLNAIPDNRLKIYNGTTYYYDDLGNLIHRELADGEVQNYFYDLHDQLVKAEIFKKDGTKETWAYSYDALGRRIGKGRLKDGEVSDGLEEETGFVWDGSHLLQEIQPDGRYTYIYTDQDSYEPLAQVRDWTTEDGESRQQTHYFHCDQIGIPREMTDKDGNLLWFGNYTGWGRLKEETKVTQTAHQPFRLQNQYCDEETGLHYNFFRYYDPVVGRFVSQDPIGLMGGVNLYQFAPNSQEWVDKFGLFGHEENQSKQSGTFRAERYIKQWICNSNTWEEAMVTAEKEKRHPDFSIHPMDDDDRTAAEHYIFMRAMVSQNSDVSFGVKLVFRVFGPWLSFGYQGAKHYGRELGIYRSASPGSYAQLYWENQGYLDGMKPGQSKYEPGRCTCD